MKLTDRTDFALRVLLLLALEPSLLHTMKSIAQRYRISKNHLSKVCSCLIQNGFIQSKRGRSGGLRLRSSPEQVNIGAVFRACEQDFTLVECFDPSRNTCVLATACTVQKPLQRALAAFLTVLDKITLADLIAHRTQAGQMRRVLFGTVGHASQNGRATRTRHIHALE